MLWEESSEIKYMHFKIRKKLNRLFQLWILEHNFIIYLKKVLNMCGNGYILCFLFGDHITSPENLLFNGAFCNDESVLGCVLSKETDTSHWQSLST